MTKFHLDARSAAFHVVGTLNEHADFAPVLAAKKRPVSLNFGETVQVSSGGVMKLLALIAAVPDRSIDFHECPPFMVELFNMIPGLTQMENHRVRVVSFFVPFICHTCNASKDVLKKAADVHKHGNQLKMAPSTCQQCGDELTPVIDDQDYLYFMQH